MMQMLTEPFKFAGDGDKHNKTRINECNYILKKYGESASPILHCFFFLPTEREILLIMSLSVTSVQASNTTKKQGSCKHFTLPSKEGLHNVFRR